MQKAYVTLILAVLSLLIAPTDSLSCEGAVDLYNQGVAAEEDRKEILYRRALEAPCDDPCIVAKIHNNLGDTYEKRGLLEKALQQYLKAIDLCPTLATPYLGAGDVYFHMDHIFRKEVMPGGNLKGTIGPGGVLLDNGWSRGTLHLPNKRSAQNLGNGQAGLITIVI